MTKAICLDGHLIDIDSIKAIGPIKQDESTKEYSFNIYVDFKKEHFIIDGEQDEVITKRDYLLESKGWTY